MVKLPLRVITRHASQRDALLNEALTLRSDLEKLAVLESQMSGEHLRPILLIQAQRVDDCKDLKARLVSEFGIAEAEIKISVGSLDELKEVKDINAANCPVRIIITVEKLREGWGLPLCLCAVQFEGDTQRHGHRADSGPHPAPAGSETEAAPGPELRLCFLRVRLHAGSAE